MRLPRRYGDHDELGHVNIDLNTLPVNTPVDQWHTIESSDEDRPYLECGSLHVTVEVLVKPNQVRRHRTIKNSAKIHVVFNC